MRVAERAEPKGVCISMLRNKAVLRDIWKAQHRVSTALHYIDVSSTGLRRFGTRCCGYSNRAGGGDRQVTVCYCGRSLAFA